MKLAAIFRTATASACLFLAACSDSSSYSQGFSAGYRRGHADGDTAGFQRGHAQGRKDGYMDGAKAFTREFWLPSLAGGVLLGLGLLAAGGVHALARTPVRRAFAHLADRINAWADHRRLGREIAAAPARREAEIRAAVLESLAVGARAAQAERVGLALEELAHAQIEAQLRESNEEIVALAEAAEQLKLFVDSQPLDPARKSALYRQGIESLSHRLPKSA